MTKGQILQEIWDNLPEKRKQWIEARTKELEAEYLALQELRKEAGLTPANLSKSMDIAESDFSTFETNADLLLSTLREYVEAVGGKLNLTIELPNKPPIVLERMGDLVDTSIIH